ncbi:hypothetical protein ACFFTR_25495 [Dactylosporangium vinaceum]|uniref:Uncharacterized protein n=1 Tax=Dactylosporangium vinaceum TaxID=53362 RepID=A0ABV5MC80_9ACTN
MNDDGQREVHSLDATSDEDGAGWLHQTPATRCNPACL